VLGPLGAPLRAPFAKVSMMSFESLNLHPTLLAALRDAGYAEATDVQRRAIPPALEGGDLMVSSSAARPRASCCPR
jgi:superfamily II DNA/RNA helicase